MVGWLIDQWLRTNEGGGPSQVFDQAPSTPTKEKTIFMEWSIIERIIRFKARHAQ